jgi:copper chaperone CopZ
MTEKMNEVRLPISGLAAPACAGHVEETLNAVWGVSSVSVNATRGHATIVYDPARVGLNALEAAIRQGGCGAAQSHRAVLRIGADRSSSAAVADRAPASLEMAADDIAETGILNALITSAVERVGAPDALVNGSCPGRGAGRGATDRLA